ncbi:hypothetical protein SESBI_10831 [Sesbania bispinosa]|nr:hypothetical protein SESBI_10831 [Sesbania bispinosa]
MKNPNPSSISYVLSFLSLQRQSRRVLIEDYLLRNKGVFLVPVFKATSWDNTYEKDPRDCPEAKVLTFQKNKKSIFSKDNSTLCSFLRRILRIFLKRDVSASSLNEPGFGIVSMKPIPVKPSEPWPDQDHVKVKKALRGIKVISFQRLISMFGNRTLDLPLALGLSKTPNPSRLLKKDVTTRLMATQAT